MSEEDIQDDDNFKYLVYAEASDGRRATFTTSSDDDLNEFLEAVKTDGMTRRYAIIPVDKIEFVHIDQETTNQDVRMNEIALARFRMESLKDDGQLEDPEAHGLPVHEISGFRFVDASGQGIPEELFQSLIEGMVQSGQLAYDEDGKLVQGPNAPQEGEMVGLEIKRDEDGDVISAERIDTDKQKLN